MQPQAHVGHSSAIEVKCEARATHHSPVSVLVMDDVVDELAHADRNAREIVD